MAVSSDAIMSCGGLVRLKELEEVLTELEVGVLKPCRLLELPRELRDIVYELALTADRPILIWSNEWHWEEVLTTSPRAGGASLLYTCQQIHCEARQIFHQRNLFAIRLDVTLDAEHSSLEGVLETRAGIPPLPKVILPTEEIRTLELYLDGLWRSPSPAFVKNLDTLTMALSGCIAHCSNLRKLIVEMNCFCSDRQDLAARTIKLFVKKCHPKLRTKADVEWVQLGGHGHLSAAESKAMIKTWTTGEVIFKGAWPHIGSRDEGHD